MLHMYNEYQHFVRAHTVIIIQKLYCGLIVSWSDKYITAVIRSHQESEGNI